MQFLKGSNTVIISAAFICCDLCATLAEILVSLAAHGLPFHMSEVKFRADILCAYRKPRLRTSHTCLNKAHSLTFKSTN